MIFLKLGKMLDIYKRKKVRKPDLQKNSGLAKNGAFRAKKGPK